jgi:DNA-binding SARP family transcriptional activator
MSGDGLRFGLLGPLVVMRGGEPVPLAGARRRALLALLVLHARERMTSDRLAEEL